ncbi:MAG: hypothetical protein QF793_04325 [Candidatus Peribacteraceae bacterium]|nr:hypothetical protein [Candidatus Peribacteraceae bacterium]
MKFARYNLLVSQQSPSSLTLGNKLSALAGNVRTAVEDRLAKYLESRGAKDDSPMSTDADQISENVESDLRKCVIALNNAHAMVDRAEGKLPKDNGDIESDDLVQEVTEDEEAVAT